MNLAEWRKENIGRKTIEAVKTFADTNYPYPFHDQSPLNKAINGRWSVLHPTWNFHEDIDDRHLQLLQIDKPELERLRTDAAICHFLGLKKPWNPDADQHSLYAHEYMAYEKMVVALIKNPQDL
jgi:lipopolysaccharide biosynthesis glycosyltransferase